MRGARLIALWLFAAASAQAQSLDGARAGVVASAVVDSAGATPSLTLTPLFQPKGKWRNVAPITSAIIPGSGQAILGDGRFVAYLAAEVLGWWMYSKDVRERSQQEAQFKEIANKVARVHFTTTFPDADWAYYEWMRDTVESGVYSKNPNGPLEPETDPATYNGARWEVIQSIYPTREQALAAYEKAAIKPEFLWSWKNHRLEWDIYKRTTDKRNDANRAAIRDILFISANHFLSMMDAFGTLRLTAVRDGTGVTRLGASVPW